MQITQKQVANQLQAFLDRRINLHVLAKWCKDAMMEGEFEEAHFDQLREAVSRIGLADVEGFGLSRTDFTSYLNACKNS